MRGRRGDSVIARFLEKEELEQTAEVEDEKEKTSVTVVSFIFVNIKLVLNNLICIYLFIGVFIGAINPDDSCL